MNKGLPIMEHPRISQNPKVMFGKPVIRGTRVTVEIILRLLGQGVSIDELLEGYPHITREDVNAAHAFAADFLADEMMAAAE